MFPEEQKPKKNFAKSMRGQAAGYIGAAFGLVAGLAWNYAIKALIETIYPQGASGGITAKFIYAAVITVIVVIVTNYLLRRED